MNNPPQSSEVNNTVVTSSPTLQGDDECSACGRRLYGQEAGMICRRKPCPREEEMRKLAPGHISSHHITASSGHHENGSEPVGPSSPTDTMEVAARWLDEAGVPVLPEPRYNRQRIESLALLLTSERLKVREECAKVADKVHDMTLPTVSYSWNGACKWIARAIRGEGAGT